ncbi:hypothetical protein ABH926_004031 [Catenulispora sp. GP43]|uniref:cell wall-binding repeat-containing protein n=1 Tax=Catenulispora sp. GP43 TaxID=3156263 RepID=UPI0035170E3F
MATGEPGWRGKVTNLAGRDRYATAAAVAGSSMFPQVDGGPLVPGLLADGASLPASELGWLKQNAPMTKTGPSGLPMGALPVFGGTSAVPDSVIKQVGGVLYGAGKYDVFDNRHLATIVGPF